MGTISRRRFVQGTVSGLVGLGASGALTPLGTLGAAAGAASPNDALTIAFIGCGGRSGSLLDPILKRRDAVVAERIAAAREGMADRWAEHSRRTREGAVLERDVFEHDSGTRGGRNHRDRRIPLS